MNHRPRVESKADLHQLTGQPGVLERQRGRDVRAVVVVGELPFGGFVSSGTRPRP